MDYELFHIEISNSIVNNLKIHVWIHLDFEWF